MAIIAYPIKYIEDIETVIDYLGTIRPNIRTPGVVRKKYTSDDLPKKIYIPNFIRFFSPSRKIFYYTKDKLTDHTITIYIPFITICRNGIMLEYEYYNKIDKTNRMLGLINGRYVINYISLRLRKAEETYSGESKMCLNTTMSYKIFDKWTK